MLMLIVGMLVIVGITYVYFKHDDISYNEYNEVSLINPTASS